MNLTCEYWPASSPASSSPLRFLISRSVRTSAKWITIESGLVEKRIDASEVSITDSSPSAAAPSVVDDSRSPSEAMRARPRAPELSYARAASSWS